MFIQEYRTVFPVEKMCNCMRASKNAFYTWLRAKDDEKVKPSKVFLKERIKILFYKSRQIYGSYRIQKALEREDLHYARSYIAKLMKEMGLRSVLSKRFKVCTTDSKHALPIAENILNRNFKSNIIGEKWVSDITYIHVGNKWNYVTTILDLADRKVVAWILSDDMTTENTVFKAWQKARAQRNITDNHVFHSDRGVQYASKKMVRAFELSSKIRQSMSRKGNCWDNAVAESFFKTLKYECTNRFNLKTMQEANKEISEYINWYNQERIHSSLGYKTPAEYELKLEIKNRIKRA